MSSTNEVLSRSGWVLRHWTGVKSRFMWNGVREINWGEIACSALLMWLTAEFVGSGLDTYATVADAVCISFRQRVHSTRTRHEMKV